MPPTVVQQSPPPPVDTRRRGIVAAALGSLFGIGMTALGGVLACWTAAIARFMMPNTIVEPASRFKAGLPGDYRFGRVETRYQQKHGVWVVCGEYGGRRQIFALRTTCTHLGCITIWQESERKFKCPCHGSGFRLDGRNFEGPAPRPLERCAIRIAEDGQLEIDCSRTFHQELGQWEDPACYVSV